MARPAHPLLSELPNPDVQDTVNNCSAVLFCLADLFGGDNEKYPILESDSARRGMWRMLFSIATTLEAVSEALAENGRHVPPVA